MSDEVESQLCPNCLKIVSNKNFTVHVLHCHRNIVLCPKCKEPFSKPQLQDHLENDHKNIRCKLCHEELENCYLEQHEKTCIKRTVQCAFCELEYALDQLNAHEDYCGSRTEKCEDCGQYVMLKDQISHLASDHLIPEKEKSGLNNNFPSLRNNFGEESVPLKTNENYYSRQNPIKRTNDMPQLNTSINDYRKDSEKIKISDLDVDSGQNLVAPGDYDALLALQLAEDEADAVNPYSPSIANPPFVNDLMDPLERSQLGVGFARGLKLPSSLISADHPFDASNLWSHDEIDQMFVPEQMVENKQNDKITTYEPNEFSDFGQNVSLPCEFCGELFPAEMLIVHESGCCPDIAHGTPHGSGTQIALSEQTSVPPMETNRSQERSQSAAEIVSTLPSKYQPYDDDSNDHNLMIACVFCNYLYPVEMLHEHEDVCSINPIVNEAQFLDALRAPVEQIKDAIPTSKLGSNYSLPSNGPTKENAVLNIKRDHNIHTRDNEERKRSLQEERKPPADRRFSDICLDNSSRTKRNASTQRPTDFTGNVKALNAVKTNPTSIKNTYPREVKQAVRPRDDLVVTGTRPKMVNSVNNYSPQQNEVSPKTYFNQHQKPKATNGSKDENIPAHCRSDDGELQEAYNRLLEMRREQHAIPSSSQQVSQARSQESQINNLRSRVSVGKTGAVPKQKRQT